jgi:hypothetical protein
LGLPSRKLDAARRATRVPAAGVQLVNFRILFQGQNQPFAPSHFVISHAFDS